MEIFVLIAVVFSEVNECPGLNHSNPFKCKTNNITSENINEEEKKSYLYGNYWRIVNVSSTSFCILKRKTKKGALEGKMII